MVTQAKKSEKETVHLIYLKITFLQRRKTLEHYCGHQYCFQELDKFIYAGGEVVLEN